MFAWRLGRAILDTFRFGLSYALVRFHIGNPKPLSADFAWHYFTGTPPRLMQTFIDVYPPRFQRRRVMARMFAQGHAAGIEHHYDVSNEFYRLFLDREFMFYTCADFERPDDTIEIAQRRKADYLLNLIRPAAGERILDLGCGWGPMLRHIHAHTGDKESLWGITLSKEQARHVREKLGFNVLLDNYITAEFMPESFDKIYGIGAMEHVRPDEVLPFLQKLHKALVPNGRLVLHFFSLNKDPLPTGAITTQLFFPGSICSLHSDILGAAREMGFELLHDSSHDYRPTLKAWFDRLVENREEALQLVGVETYNRYLVFFPVSWVGFNQKQVTLHRLVLEKDNSAPTDSGGAGQPTHSPTMSSVPWSTPN